MMKIKLGFVHWGTSLPFSISHLKLNGGKILGKLHSQVDGQVPLLLIDFLAEQAQDLVIA